MSVQNITVQNQLRKGTLNQERDFDKLQYPLLTGDQNGNEVSSDTGSLSDSFRSVSCLSYGTSADSPVEMSECNSSMDHAGEAFNHNSVFLNESIGEPMLEGDLGISGRTELVSFPWVKEHFKGIMQPNLEADPNLEKWNPNLTLVVPCMQECTKNKNNCSVDISTKKIDLESVTPGNEMAIDADEMLPDPPVTKKSPVSSNSPENGSADNMHASLDSLSSNEMVMRSNSFMLTSSEKPLSASVLEAANSTSSISSDQGKFSSTMPDVCGGTFENNQPEISSCNFDAKQCTVEVAKELHEDVLQVECSASQGQPNYLHPALLGSFSGAAAVEYLSVPDHFVKDLINLEISDQEGAILIHTHEVGENAVDPSTQDIPMLKADVVMPQLTLMLSPNEGVSAGASDETFLIRSPEEKSNYHTHTSTPLPESKNVTFIIPSFEIPEQATKNAKEDLCSCNDKSPVQTLKGNQLSYALKIQESTRPTTSTTSKTAKVEILKYPKPDFKNIKPKVVSRPLVKTDNPSHIKNTQRSPSTPSKGCPLPRASQSQKEEGSEKGHDIAQEKASRNQKQVMACAQRFPSKITPFSAVSKTVVNRVQKPASNLRQRNGVLDKGSSSNSTSSLFSETAVTDSHNRFSRTILNNKAEKTKSSVISVSLSRKETMECNDLSRANKETGDLTSGIVYELNSGAVATTSSMLSTELAVDSDISKSRVGQRPSLSKPKSSVGPQTTSADFRLPPAAPKLKLGSLSKDGRTTGILSPPRTKQMPAYGTHKIPISTRAKTSSARMSMNTGSVSARSATGSRLPVKAAGLERSSSVSSLLSSHSEPSTGTCRSQSTTATSCKTVDKSSRPILSSGALNSARTSKAVMRNKTAVNPTSATGNKTNSSQNQVCSRSTTSQNQITPRTAPGISARQVGSSAWNRLAVDKNKLKTSPRSRPPRSQTQPDLLPTENTALGLAHYKTQCEKKNECIQQFKKLLATSNHRFEAITVVVQHILAEREQALKQHKETSQELVNLHRELVSTTTSCDKLEREKDELRTAFEAVLQKVQEQHQGELADLEERLKNFYLAEWEKVHEAYQEQAEKLKTQLQQQVNALNSQHEAFRKELETSHSEKIAMFKQQYETTLEELKKSHELENNSLNESFKETEASLSEKIDELTSLNNSLNEKLKAEEDRRKALHEKNQKDSHTLYLEQELESLKVVLDIKNEQLHQHDKKLMQMEKMVERNNKLDECLKKVQQENEDFRARMDRHAALSRQLSTEQTVLQESLEKESKVNKRLSMENEELLWKLHNGDLCSPRKLSPSSPSMSFQSPRNSGVFSSPAVTPR
ncbi:microtubule-associated tumor suppressor 1 homolog isoform X2 [Polyodon spathula]|uniref:microtubule-associated tumor suppressor 1 homolog isoform X2 n=1 Tax=Polyodon spathula TaxID=7913 RepID=UPI001B7EFAD5|nr:microtubule-associated tumor suppressor 1 homolog isoform X2 [Polyodon spathula]